MKVCEHVGVEDSLTGNENDSSLGSLGKGHISAAPYAYTHTTLGYRKWCLNQAYSAVKLLLSGHVVTELILCINDGL